MKQLLKKIYTILILIKNVILKKNKYKLHFVAKKDQYSKKWYYDFKHWGFEHTYLEMTNGTDKLCELYANGKNELTVNVICSEKPISHPTTIYDEFIVEPLPKKIKSHKDKLTWGRNYICVDPNDEDKITRMWICPFMLFVLGRYPKCIYIQKNTL